MPWVLQTVRYGQSDPSTDTGRAALARPPRTSPHTRTLHGPAYLDRTGDLQTVALLAAHVVPKRYKDRRGENWVETYASQRLPLPTHRTATHAHTHTHIAFLVVVVALGSSAPACAGWVKRRMEKMATNTGKIRF